MSNGRMEATVAEDDKRKALVFLGLALVMTLLIGSGLPRLKFEPGLPLPSVEGGAVVALSADATPAVQLPIPTLLLIVLLTIATVYLSILAYRIIRGANWKDLRVNWEQWLSEFSRLVFYVLIVFGLVFLVLVFLPKSEGPRNVVPLPEPRPIVRSPLGPVPALLVWLVGVGLFLAVVLLGLQMLRAQRSAAPELWELEAEQARQNLLAGGDLKDVILQCYLRMSQALQQERGIERGASVTVGEFERLLADKGLPREAVHQLTLLFQAVRYGHWQPSSSEEQKALGSLEAILKASRAARQEM